MRCSGDCRASGPGERGTVQTEGTKAIKARQADISTMSGAQSGGTVRVLHGIHALSVGVAGRTVSEVREALGQALNISPRAIALVDGQEVGERHILLPGQRLEFVRQSGEKGQRVESPGDDLGRSD